MTQQGLRVAVSQGTSIAMTKDEYYNQKSLEYLQRHPNVTLRYARRQARLRYRRYAKKLQHV